MEYDTFNAVCCAGKDSSSPSGFVIQGDAGTLRGEGSVSTLSEIYFSDRNGETLLAEFDGKIKLSYELTEFERQFSAKDYDSCYQMLDHSVAVAEGVDELLK